MAKIRQIIQEKLKQLFFLHFRPAKNGGWFARTWIAALVVSAVSILLLNINSYSIIITGLIFNYNRLWAAIKEMFKEGNKINED